MAHRPNILKLASKISLESLTYTGITYNDPEYKCLDVLLTDDMAEVLYHLKLDTPRTVEEIAKRCKRDLDFTREQVEKLQETGVVRYKLIDGVKKYYYPIWVPGIMEGFLANKEQCDRFPILGECFEEYTRRRMKPLLPFVDRGMIFMRILPVEKAIQNSTRRASYDELSYLIENATAISVGPCSCRRSRRLMGEGCGHLEDDICMYLNDNARTFVENGFHRYISKEEAYEVLRRAEDNGLMHEVNQTDGWDHINAICNCCGCSCFSLRIANYFQVPEAIKSNFVAEVDKDKCVACGQCVENCQVGALRLGKKLCSVKPEPEKKPALTVNDTLWFGDKHYNADYRTNRSDVMPEGTAPCKSECPAHIPVQGYIKLAAQGKYLEALELIKKENPFPAVCGRICNRRCEDACTRGSVDEAVAIDDIKKFIADQELRAETRFVPPMVNMTGKPFPQKIAVIGAGPAGLSCAYYLAVKGYKPTIFEKESRPGGMLMNGIPSFRLEKDVVQAEIDILEEMGVEFRYGIEVGRDITIPQLRSEGYQGFYVAIGAQGGRKAGVPGEDAEGVIAGVNFVRDVNLGKAEKLTGRTVVIGGGNVAVDVARTAIRMGSKETSMFCLETRDIMPAAADEVAEAEAEGIRVQNGWGPKEILVEDGKVKGVVFKKCTSVFDAQHRFAPKYDENDLITVECEHVLLSIGQSIVWGELLKDTRVEFNRNGTAKADPFTYQTAEPDIFVGGDVFTGPKFAIDAIAAGKEAAVSLHRYVHEGQTLTLGRDHRDYRAFDKHNIALSLDCFDRAPRQRPAAGESAPTSFRDARGTFTEEQLQKETARCLGCGAVVVNQHQCLGCGICTTKCKFDAIHLVKDYDYAGTPYRKTLVNVLGTGSKRIGKFAAKAVTKPIQKG